MTNLPSGTHNYRVFVRAFFPGNDSLVSLKVDLLPMCVNGKYVGECSGTAFGHSPNTCGYRVFWPWL